MEQSLVSDAVVSESLNQARHLWHLRESIPLAQAEEGLNIKHDILVPVSRIPEFAFSLPKATTLWGGKLKGRASYGLYDEEGGLTTWRSSPRSTPTESWRSWTPRCT